MELMCIAIGIVLGVLIMLPALGMATREANRYKQLKEHYKDLVDSLIK